MSEQEQAGRTATQVPGEEGFAEVDDSALLRRRAQMRAELERLPQSAPEHVALAALYDISTREVSDRARRAWAQAGRAAR